MAKRYYQSNKSEKRMVGEEYYASFDESRRRQLEDSGMLSEDRRQVANLPQEVIMKSYDRTDYARYDLDDTMRVVDDQIDRDVRGARKQRSKSKY